MKVMSKIPFGFFPTVMLYAWNRKEQNLETFSLEVFD